MEKTISHPEDSQAGGIPFYLQYDELFCFYSGLQTGCGLPTLRGTVALLSLLTQNVKMSNALTESTVFLRCLCALWPSQD